MWSEALFGAPPSPPLLMSGARLYLGALGARGAGQLAAYALSDGSFAWRLDASDADVRWIRLLGPQDGLLVAAFGRDDGVEVLVASASDGSERGRALLPMEGVASQPPALSLDAQGVHVGARLVSYDGQTTP